MPLTSNDPRDIEQYVQAFLASPMYIKKFTVATKPTDLKWRYHAIYITDTSKPAFMDAAGTWRYADGTTV